VFLLVDEGHTSNFWPKVPRVLIGDWSDTERLLAMVEDWKVLRPGRYAVETRINGPAHILRVRVL
jgi:hypothetical protein